MLVYCTTAAADLYASCSDGSTFAPIFEVASVNCGWILDLIQEPHFSFARTTYVVRGENMIMAPVVSIAVDISKAKRYLSYTISYLILILCHRRITRQLPTRIGSSETPEHSALHGFLHCVLALLLPPFLLCLSNLNWCFVGINQQIVVAGEKGLSSNLS